MRGNRSWIAGFKVDGVSYLTDLHFDRVTRLGVDHLYELATEEARKEFAHQWGGRDSADVRQIMAHEYEEEAGAGPADKGRITGLSYAEMDLVIEALYKLRLEDNTITEDKSISHLLNRFRDRRKGGDN
jgi:hypothetical protein